MVRTLTTIVSENRKPPENIELKKSGYNFEWQIELRCFKVSLWFLCMQRAKARERLGDHSLNRAAWCTGHEHREKMARWTLGISKVLLTGLAKTASWYASLHYTHTPYIHSITHINMFIVETKSALPCSTQNHLMYTQKVMCDNHTFKKTVLPLE